MKMSELQHCGFISLLYSIGDKPLNLWSKHISPDGKVRRVADEILNGDKVIEITGPHEVPVCTNIGCPSDSMEVLNIKLPILVLIIKNLESKLKLEFQILDKKRYRRKFTFTTYERTPTVNVTAAQLPLKLEEDWNNLEINFQVLCQDIFGIDYEVLQRIIIYPNCRLRRVYLQDRHYEHDETPVELCQAFFDMYMLKWGIHLVDRSSQTEESYIGSLQPYDLERYTEPQQPCDLELVANENNPTIPVLLKSSFALHNVSKRIQNKFISCTRIIDRDKIVVAKLNSKSVNEVDAKGKVKKHKNNENGNDSKKIKPEKKFDKEKKATESPSIYLNDASVPPPKPLLNFPLLEKSKYLQMFGNPFLSKFDKEGKIFSKWPYKFEELNGGIKNNPPINDSIIKLKSISNDPNQKIQYNNLTFPGKESFLKMKNTSFQDQNVRNIKNIINEVQRVREQLNNKNYNFESKVKFQESNDNVIPYFVELEAKPLEKKSKSKLLTTDEIVTKFLKSRFIANKKMYERLREKGLTMTEVELSIYNSKNRRNCYGQGKIIESCRGSTNKATGLGVIKSLEADKSLKDNKLIDDKDYPKLKKELDVILFPLQDSNQIASSTQLFTIQKDAGTEAQIYPKKNSSKSASVNYLWKETKDGNNNVKFSIKCNSNQKIIYHSNSCNENHQLIT